MVTSGAAPTWLDQTGLLLTEEGFIATQDTLQAVSDPAVFAVGDIASIGAHPRPKSGVFAVRHEYRSRTLRKDFSESFLENFP